MKFGYPQFPVIPSPTVPIGILHRPVVPLRVTGTKQTVATLAWVDTGADDTVLPLSICRRVGASLDPSQTWSMEAFGAHPVRAILASVKLELSDGMRTFTWSTNVGAVDFVNVEDEVTIVGHAGFLEFFRATFDGHLHEIELEITPAFSGVVH